MANIFGMKRDLYDQETALKTANGFKHCLKVTRTSVHIRLKIGPSFFQHPL